MRIRLLIYSLLMGLSISSAWAQEAPRFRAFLYEGQYYMTGELDPIDITAPYPSAAEIRRGKRKIRKFTRLRYNVHRVYPYAVKVGKILDEAYQEMAHLTEKKERKAFLKAKEKALFKQYEKDLKKMTRTQGKVLIKLIHRQTGQSSYQLIKDTRGGVTAFFWQTLGRMFGMNLKLEFDEESDYMIGVILRELDRGGYNIVYRRYNYELP